MVVFVYEYASAQSDDAEVPSSVRTEGRAMRDALAADFASIGGCRVTTLDRVPSTEEKGLFLRHAGRADWTVVIAPEFDDLLRQRLEWASEAGGRVLGPPIHELAKAADKWQTYSFLRRHGIPTPETRLAPFAEPGRFSGPSVIKPRYGAGGIGIGWYDRPGVATIGQDAIVQAYVPGQAASVTLLMGPNQVVPLAPTRQKIDIAGGFVYRGGSAPIETGLAQRATHLAEAVAGHLNHWTGFVGVDMVLGDCEDGSGDYVLEINPRLTTSYVGLRKLALDNLAERAVAVAIGGRVEPIRWRSSTVVNFTVGGVTIFWSESPSD